MESGSRLLYQIEQGLARAFESMTGRTFSINPERRSPAGAFDDSIVWRQTLSSSPNASFWFVAPRELWNMAGRLTLEAAGIDEIGDNECRSTWIEICGQAIAGAAGGITADLGREVTAARGTEQDTQPEDVDWNVFAIRNDDGDVFRLRVAWTGDVAALYERAAAAEPRTLPNDATSVSKTFDLLLDVALPVSVSFGKTSLQIREVLKLNTGSIVELDRLVSEPVDVIVNDCVIARGEVVVVDGNYGVRITNLASREDRLRSGISEAQSRIGGRP